MFACAVGVGLLVLLVRAGFATGGLVLLRISLAGRGALVGLLVI